MSPVLSFSCSFSLCIFSYHCVHYNFAFSWLIVLRTLSSYIYELSWISCWPVWEFYYQSELHLFASGNFIVKSSTSRWWYVHLLFSLLNNIRRKLPYFNLLLLIILNHLSFFIVENLLFFYLLLKSYNEVKPVSYSGNFLSNKKSNTM
jgi:hypothetical protein